MAGRCILFFIEHPHQRVCVVTAPPISFPEWEGTRNFIQFRPFYHFDFVLSAMICILPQRWCIEQRENLINWDRKIEELDINFVLKILLQNIVWRYLILISECLELYVLTWLVIVVFFKKPIHLHLSKMLNRITLLFTFSYFFQRKAIWCSNLGCVASLCGADFSKGNTVLPRKKVEAKCAAFCCLLVLFM